VKARHLTRLFSYTIPIDDGAAPNPFHGMCTLAICKPTIRRVAQPGDWVAGLGSKNAPGGRDLSRRLVYAMLVHEAITLKEYDRRAEQEWPHRIPIPTSRDLAERLGDCIYDYRSGAPPAQRLGVHGADNVEGDLSGVNVLIAYDFYYFGSSAIPLPKELLPICHQGQGHKSNANAPYVATFEHWIRGLGLGGGQIYGWPDTVIEWSSTRVACGCEPRAKERADDPVC
jgi:Nucleotide modification associated domain 2